MGKGSRNREIRKRAAGKTQETVSKDKVKVVIDMKNGVIAAHKEVNGRHKVKGLVSFNGPSRHSYPTHIFSKQEIFNAEDQMLYWADAREKDEAAQDRMVKRMKRYADPTVYRTLVDYDVSNDWNGLHKSEEYARIMLREPTIERFENESKRSFERRDLESRRKALADAGINITYDISLLNTNNILDNLKVLKYAFAGRKVSNIKMFGLTFEPKKSKPLTLSRTKEYSRRALTRKKEEVQKAPLKIKKNVEKKKFVPKTPGLIKELRRKAKDVHFTQKVKRAVATTGLITLVGIGGFAVGYGVGNNNNVAANVDSQVAQTMETKPVVTEKTEHGTVEAQLAFDASADKEIYTVAPITDNPVKDVEVSSQGDIAQELFEDSSEPEEEVVQAETSDAEIADEEIVEEQSFGFGSAFTLDEGRFYEGPGGQGRSGSYERISNKELTISMIDVCAKDGLHVIRPSDRKSIQELREEYGEDVQMYACVVSLDGKNLYGWDDLGRVEEAMQKYASKTQDNIRDDRDSR